MASGGSSRRPLSESRSFDVGSDEFLFSYDDYAQQRDQTANAKRSDSSAKDLHENKAGRPLANIYGQQEKFTREDVISFVEICMKKYADNLMRNLDEINGRLTQLELFCYKLERSLNEFRTDMIHGQSEGNVKLNSLEKHVQMVQRSLQTIRDKQELLETHKELTILQLSQSETANSSLYQKHNKDVAALTSDTEIRNGTTDGTNQQLALALPNQMPTSAPTKAPDQNPPLQQPPPPPNSHLQDRYVLSQASTYYTQHQAPPQHPHSEAYQQSSLMQNPSVQPPAPQQPRQPQQFSQYRQQQWPQPPLPQQPASSAYLPYAPEAFQSSSALPPSPYSAPQSSIYGGAGSNVSQSPPPHNPWRSSIYGDEGRSFSHPPPQYNAQLQPPTPTSHISSVQGYNPAFVVDGSRAGQPQSYHRGKQIALDQPYREMIEKAVIMGYTIDHVVSVVNRMGETGQPFDFNDLLDELTSHANGGPPRSWSR